MVQLQMDWDRFRNVSNLVLVESNRIRDLIYACNRLLISILKMLHTCTYHLTMQDIHTMLAVMSITFFFVADVSVLYIKFKKKTTEQMLNVDRIRSNKSSKT